MRSVKHDENQTNSVLSDLQGSEFCLRSCDAGSRPCV